MFHLPSESALKELEDFNEPYCVSIYFPYSKPVTTGTNPNFISLKNLIREADEVLSAAYMDEKTIKRTLRPARKLLTDQVMASLRDEGMTLFLHENFSRIYKIPDGHLEPLVTIEYGFNLDPLRQTIEDNTRYYLLALSHENVRLFEGDRYSLGPVYLRNFPASMSEALRLDEYPRWSETHSVAPANRAARSEGFHSQYNQKQVDKKQLLQFFHLVDQRLHKFLHAKQTPLVLAGVGYLIPIYKKVNSYHFLAPKAIVGNTDHARLSELQRKAWEIVHQPSFDKSKRLVSTSLRRVKL